MAKCMLCVVVVLVAGSLIAFSGCKGPDNAVAEKSSEKGETKNDVSKETSKKPKTSEMDELEKEVFGTSSPASKPGKVEVVRSAADVLRARQKRTALIKKMEADRETTLAKEFRTRTAKLEEKKEALKVLDKKLDAKKNPTFAKLKTEEVDKLREQRENLFDEIRVETAQLTYDREVRKADLDAEIREAKDSPLDY